MMIILEMHVIVQFLLYEILFTMNYLRLWQVQIAEVCMSLFTCGEVSYYGYLYAKIKDKEYYQIATGCAKAGMLSGTCVSGLIGQLVIYMNNCDYSILPYYSIVGTVFNKNCDYPQHHLNLIIFTKTKTSGYTSICAMSLPK